MTTMQPTNRHWRYLLAVLLTGVLLRAFIPAGYMPAAPGQGLLFELCGADLPSGFSSVLKGDDGHSGQHAGHDAHDEHGSDSDCSFGHILSFAFIDAAEMPDVATVAPVGVVIAVVAELRPVTREYSYAPRGPPIL